MDGINAIISYSNFTRNKAIDSDGGAIYVKGTNTNITFCNFDFNNSLLLFL